MLVLGGAGGGGGGGGGADDAGDLYEDEDADARGDSLLDLRQGVKIAVSD